MNSPPNWVFWENGRGRASSAERVAACPSLQPVPNRVSGATEFMPSCNGRLVDVAVRKTAKVGAYLHMPSCNHQSGPSPQAMVRYRHRHGEGSDRNIGMTAA